MIQTIVSRTKKMPSINPPLVWNEDGPPAENYRRLGERLAATGDLYRSPEYGTGLILVRDNGKPTTIEHGKDLFPVITDRVVVQVLRDGKSKGGRIPAAHLEAMLRSESFLCNFRNIDRISTHPVCLADWSFARPGYNDGGDGHRILFTGLAIEPVASVKTINSFLEVMAFETEADRTNALAAALTVLFRDHWPGGNQW